MTTIGCSIALATALAVGMLVVAQSQLVTETRVNLRRTPSTELRPIRVLARATELTLEGSDTPTNGFYRVRTSQDEVGWVSADYVAWTEDMPALIGAGETRVIGLDSPAAAIDPDWERSPRRGTTMRHDTDGRTCPSRGEPQMKSDNGTA